MSVPQTTLDLFSTTADEWLDEARHEAEKIAIRTGRVTIDDVLAVVPRPPYVHKNITGMMFKDSVFRCIGFTKSRRPLAKGRIVCVWEVKEEYYPKNVIELQRRLRQERAEYV